MTLQQRRAVLQWRGDQRFPLHKPPHTGSGSSWYFITAATYEHKRLFQKESELVALQMRLLRSLHDANIACAARVVFPNHYHLLAYADLLAKLGKILGLVHGKSSRYANLRDATVGRQVWYRYADRQVRSERHFWTCLYYIVHNPVKHQYAKSPTLWPFSCVHELVDTHGDSWIDDLRREYPLRDFGKFWDNV